MPDKGVFWEGISEGIAEKLEGIIEFIPLLGSYLRRENDREVDKLIREHMAERFDGLKRSVMKVMEAGAESGRLEGLEKLDRYSRRLDKLRDTVKFAAHGYSGLFDRIKVRDEELEALFNYDLQMLAKIEETDKRLSEIDKVLDNDEKLKGEIDALADFISEMETIVQDRKYAVTKGGQFKGEEA
ncbi:MAG: hypothetical protein JW984_08010 [Deltaproteobacteria bacterium]|uniref:Uncharacterized protein n=1 Tax=Candidatus Zymogenus saltonus TaxID=2844893 RepID=A0A9D8PNE5_9DELT|nr:hypothetical protein [Candidatus Zymogenus saltonus]